MKQLILTFIGLMLLLPVTASHAISPTTAKLNECMLFLGLAGHNREPYQLKFNVVLQAAKDLRKSADKGFDPKADHLESLVNLAARIHRAVYLVAGLYVSDEIAARLAIVQTETLARIQEKRLTYAYMLELPLRLNSAFVGVLHADHLSYKHDDQIEHALKNFPRQLHIPVMQGQLVRSERDQLLDLGVWPIEIARRKTYVGGVNVDPYALAIHEVSLANHLSRLGNPKFWMGLMPYLMDGIMRAELDNQLKDGTLRPVHEAMFSTYAAYLFELQRNCPTVECLVIHLTQTKALDTMIEHVERGMGESFLQVPKGHRPYQELTDKQKRKTKNLGKIYLQTFKKVLLRYAENAWDQEATQNK